MIEPSPNPTVLCFGELLWDSLPEGLFPGGAPVNVAYHLQQLGVNALPVTAVGRDFLGDELLRRLQQWGLDTRYVARLPGKSTGLVRVTLQSGTPSYEIVEEVAWDWIEIPEELLEIAGTASALVFGSLAQREEHNRRQLARLRECCRHGWNVFDVNLRPPFDAVDRIWALGQKADLIKLNEAELQQLLGQTLQPDHRAEGARRMAHQTGCPRICLTAGAAGAGLLIDSTWYWSPGRSIRVQDTVGAGDSFLATLIAGLLTGDRSPQQILDQACRLAEFVAGQKGATPAYSLTDQGKILPKQE